MEKLNKTLKNDVRGITLIALVITIIVLLILAGISISMLSGDNSILQKATTAKQTSERAEAKEQAQMDIMAYIADKTAKHQDASLDDEKIKEILSDNKSYVKEAGDISFTTKKGEYVIPYSELYQSKTSTNNDDDDTTVDTEYPYRTPYIPTGFSHTGSEDWNHGYTITGRTNTTNAGDEFVWVPCVLDQAKVKPGDTVQTFTKIITGAYNNFYTLHPAGGTNARVNEEDASVAEIRTSVGKYGGFYIAKYEAGIAGTKDSESLETKPATDGSVKPKSQAGIGVWDSIDGLEEALRVSKSMIPEETGAKSALISGECWDTTLAWITATADSSYAENSEGKGNYSGDRPENGFTTGHYGTNTNNIFDMGGNVAEYTSEECMYEYVDDDNTEINQEEVIRGGCYKDSGSVHPAASRDTASWEIGFRCVLYK